MIDQEIDYSEYFEYLDELRLSGVTNMFGAAPYIQEEFGLTKSESVNILKLWMNSFKG